MRHVLREMHQQLVIPADAAVARDRGNQHDATRAFSRPGMTRRRCIGNRQGDVSKEDARRWGTRAAAMATTTQAAASQSAGRGTSPTMKVALRVPTMGTAMMENALAEGGSCLAIENQMTCA
jgi:hypothetical protein